MSLPFLAKLFLSTLLLLNLISCEQDQLTESNFLSHVEDQFEKENDEGADIGAEIEAAMIECDEASINNSLKTHEFVVNFPAAIECEFNEEGLTEDDLNSAGNGPRLNQKIRARVEQYYKENLPASSTVCDMNFNFPLQDMQYDDEIFLTLNDYVLMSSQNYSESTTPYADGLKVNDMGYQEYKWMGENGLYNLLYEWNVTPKYCVGLDDTDPEYHNKCFIPATETLGQIKLDIPKEDVVKLSVLSKNFTNHEALTEMKFGFITTGDNDNGDCEHAAYAFNVSIKYINR